MAIGRNLLCIPGMGMAQTVSWIEPTPLIDGDFQHYELAKSLAILGKIIDVRH
jgi:hypothetical protein